MFGEFLYSHYMLACGTFSVHVIWTRTFPTIVDGQSYVIKLSLICPMLGSKDSSCVGRIVSNPTTEPVILSNEDVTHHHIGA